MNKATLHRVIVLWRCPAFFCVSLLLAGPGAAQTFTEVSAAAGVNDGGNWWGMAWADYDNDGDLDLYLTYESGPEGGLERNRLYRNEGDGTFADVARAAGVDGVGGAGVAWADYDNDGDLDLYVSAAKYRVNNLLNWLYRNEGDGTFADVAQAAGVDDAGGGGWRGPITITMATSTCM